MGDLKGPTPHIDNGGEHSLPRLDDVVVITADLVIGLAHRLGVNRLPFHHRREHESALQFAGIASTAVSSQAKVDFPPNSEHLDAA